MTARATPGPADGARPDREERALLGRLRAERAERAERVGSAGSAAGDAGDYAQLRCSLLAEPGDSLMGAFLAALGPERLLGELLAETPPARLAGLLAERAPELGEAGALRAGVRAAVERWRPRLGRDAPREALRAGVAAGLRLLLPGDGGWPQRLDDLGPNAPVALWVRGQAGLLAAPSLAMVGSRAASGYGEHVTAEFAAGAVRAGRVVISGAAYGIDGVAHRGALAEDGGTIAVLAGGADRVYPRGHHELLRRIAASGLVCAELPPGAAPTRWRFLQRNRLIAALGDATLVCEAGLRSGSLNTAGHAAALGRDLGAVPGPITAAGSAGCHRLLRDYGAVAVTSLPELRELLGEASEAAAWQRAMPAEHRRLLDALPLRGARAEAVLARLSGLSPGDTAAGCAELALLGLLEETPRGWRRGGGTGGP